MNINMSIIEHGNTGPVIIWMMHPFVGNEAEHLCECLKALDADMGYTLAVCNISDWGGQLSPWRAPQASGDGFFDGYGNETLKWIADTALPELHSKYPGRKFVIAGYSLAGLFALWAGYETDLFDGIVCCSGSLWFYGWSDYAASRSVKSRCSVYLSLGGKESKTTNPVMATIQTATKSQELRLASDTNVDNVIFELNPGGHFADSGKRLAKGIKWIISKIKINRAII